MTIGCMRIQQLADRRVNEHEGLLAVRRGGSVTGMTKSKHYLLPSFLHTYPISHVYKPHQARNHLFFFHHHSINHRFYTAHSYPYISSCKPSPSSSPPSPLPPPPLPSLPARISSPPSTATLDPAAPAPCATSLAQAICVRDAMLLLISARRVWS